MDTELTEGVPIPVDSKRPPTPRIQRRSLQEEVSDRLREMIVEGELEPGTRISEKDLCARFGISRTPLRESLKVLAREDLIELQPNRGARVARVTPAEVEERFEVVAGLERLAGELAVERASDREIRRVRDLHERMVECYKRGDRHNYFVLNEDIHNAIIELAGNPVLAAVHEGLMAKIRRPRYIGILSQERWGEALAEHEQMLEHLERRDGGALGGVMYEHGMRTAQCVKTAVEADQERSPA